jgi:thiamine-phosphate pyrophosphorylase
MSDPRLRLILVSDGVGDPRRIEEVVQAALRGGCRCVQLREPRWSARAMLRACEALRPMLDAVDGLLLVNDRVDVVAAGVAHGAQVGHRSLPPATARAVLGRNLVLGYSAHDEQELDEAADGGCNFALLSPVWRTTSKPDAAFLGVARAGALTEAARVPVVWLGGVDVATMAELVDVPAGQRPVGVAVRSAIMATADPEAATRALLQALPERSAAPSGD